MTSYEVPIERPRGQLEEMIRGLSTDEQVRLLAIMLIRRGTYLPRQWQTAIKDAKAALQEGRAERLIGLSKLPEKS